jgi:hypothetical protein
MRENAKVATECVMALQTEWRVGGAGGQRAADTHARARRQTRDGVREECVQREAQERNVNHLSSGRRACIVIIVVRGCCVMCVQQRR